MITKVTTLDLSALVSEGGQSPYEDDVTVNIFSGDDNTVPEADTDDTSSTTSVDSTTLLIDEHET